MSAGASSTADRPDPELTSAPELNARPAPARTITCVPSSAAASSTARKNSSRSSVSNALSFAGRLNVSRRTRSCWVTSRRGSDIATSGSQPASDQLDEFAGSNLVGVLVPWQLVALQLHDGARHLERGHLRP